MVPDVWAASTSASLVSNVQGRRDLCSGSGTPS
jgi:hypothetical protein